MKKYLLFSLILLIPASTHAMTRPVFSSILNNLTGGVTRFVAFDGGNGVTLNSTNVTRTPVAVPGVVDNLNLVVVGSPGVGAVTTITLLKNGSATSQTCTFTDPIVACSDTAHPITVAAGDDLSYQIADNGGSSVSATITNTFTGTNAGETDISGDTNGTVSGATGYWSLNGGTNRTAEASSSDLVPTSFTLDHLYCQSAGSSGGGWTYTLYKNDVATSLSCTIATFAATSSDLTDSISFVASDTVSMQIVTNGSPTAKVQAWGMRLTPTIDGEFPIMTVGSTPLLTGGTRFPMIYTTSGNNSTDTGASAFVPTAFTLKKLYVAIVSSTGSWTITSRKNAGAGTLSVAVTNAVGSDLTHSDSFAANDLVNWRSVPSGASGIQEYKISGVAFIQPSPSIVTVIKNLFQGGDFKIRGGSFNLK